MILETRGAKRYERKNKQKLKQKFTGLILTPI